MTEVQSQQILALVEKEESPFKKAVYQSFLVYPQTNPVKERLQAPVLLDIIRAHCVILNQDVILKTPTLHAVQAYISVYNILFAEEFEIMDYIQTYFIKEELDEDDNNLFFNEAICKSKEDGLYYLCDCGLKPVDKGYETIEEVLETHSLSIVCQ